MQIWQLIVAGIIVHVVLFYSIFDIYFTTPLVHGMTPVKAPIEPPAKRLFLFVTDGLRADKFYSDEKGIYRAPYLRGIIEKEGAWGVSHTRVPTETRPGHVALIAGFYEDVSAVTKGWKENPVEFDSVFNETRQTWSWGSPDVLPMFAKGASGKHVNINCYPAGFEDFARYDKTKLDKWVFDKVRSFFSSASTNATLKQLLQSDGVVFFLHLLGLDTNGHSRKPHSRDYLDNIKVVDDGVRKIVDMVNTFYNNDGKSAFIVTSDHGMTDWGSHGAGDDEETMTPFVAWGAGIRHPVVVDHCGVHTDDFCAKWNLEKIRRTDMEQADVAPLMTALIGIPFPLNSVGRLPIDVLSGSTRDQAELLLANALQILAQYDVKMNQVKERTISATFRDFPELREVEKLHSLMQIRQLMQNGHYSESISETKVLMKKALDGLRYFQTYDRFFLGACVVLGFTGWMAYIMSILTFEHTAIGKGVCRDQKTSTFLSQAFGILAVFVIVLLFVQSLPLMCYLYCLLPVFLWFKSAAWLRIVLKSLYDLYVKAQLKEVFFSVLLCVVGLEIAIFSFYYRELLSVGLMVLALRPVIKQRITCDKRCDLMSTDFGWVVSCLITAIFPLLPVIGRDKHYDWVCYSGILAVIVCLIMYSKVAFTTTRNVKLIFLLQLMLIVVSVVIVLVTADSIQDANGLPLPCQIGSWTILALSCVLPLVTPTTIGERLFSLTMAFLASYLLLSIAHEIFFFLSLSSLLYFWLKIEADGEQHTFHKIIAYSIPLQNVEQVDFLHHEDSKDNLSRSTSTTKNVELEDLHTAFVFIFLIVTAFFGTGNIASINSFDPASVYCFLTVFSPFRMGALLMLKIAIPFLLVTCFLRAIVVVTQTSLRSLTLIVLIMSDFMGLHFFFLVRDYGSWLEIGTTISHYVIVMTMIIFILLLLGVSYALTSWGRVRLSVFISRICKKRQWST